MSLSRPFLFSLLVLAFALNILVLAALFYEKPASTLEVTFLPIGQGDAILIETPSGADILIDGGPDRSVLRELPKAMGPLDRTIDLVIATHPDKDHIAGLSDVFARYRVATFMEPGVVGDSSFVDALEWAADHEPQVARVLARRGMRIQLGGGAYADVLYPDRDVSTLETNTASIVLRVVYGETEFLLSGDAPSAIERYVVSLDGAELRSDVLKAGHHGSRTSTDAAWLAAADPDYVVISAGKRNSYGHPHEEVVSRIIESGATMLTTMDGAVTFVSNGKTVTVK